MTTGESGELEAYIADHRAELFELALDLLSVDTANPPGDTREIVALLEEYLSQFPVDVERFAVDPAKPNLLVTLPGASDRTLLYNGHLDTVPFDADVWSFDPLGERVDDRSLPPRRDRHEGSRRRDAVRDPRVHRDGHRTARRPRVRVRQRRGGRRRRRPPLRCSRPTASRPTPASSANRPARGASLRDGRRSGSIWLTLEATGEAAHGSRPVLGENAIDRLYDAVTTLRERFGTRRLEVDHAIEPIIDESIAFYEPTMGAETARELFETPTINPASPRAGRRSTASRSARAEVDIRLTAGVRTPDVPRRSGTASPTARGSQSPTSPGASAPPNRSRVRSSRPCPRAPRKRPASECTDGAPPVAATRRRCETSGFRRSSSRSEPTPSTPSTSTRRPSRRSSGTRRAMRASPNYGRPRSTRRTRLGDSPIRD